MRAILKTIITYGTFDLFHVGHVRLLKRLRQLGDRLVVGVSSDEFNEIKGKTSFFSYSERAEIVASCQYVSEVFPEHHWEQKKDDIINFSADVFAMGSDWEGKFDYLKDYCDVVYLSRTEDISTTKIKSMLNSMNGPELQKIEDSLLDILTVVKSITNN